MTPITIRVRPLTDYLQMLRTKTRFAISRWGDGEWMALLGHSGGTCDGQQFSRGLREALTAVLMAKPPYELALGPMAIRRFAGEIERWLARRQLQFDWTSANVFAYASRDGHLSTLTGVLHHRPVVLVGPDYLSALKLFPIRRHVIIDRRNAFAEIADVADRVQRVVRTLPDRQPPVIAISAGPAAKVLVHQVYLQCPTATVIDFGSVWDPYAGQITRTYHRGVSLDLPPCA